MEYRTEWMMEAMMAIPRGFETERQKEGSMAIRRDKQMAYMMAA